MSQSADLKSPDLTGEHIKVTPVYESNPPNSEENPAYIVSRVVDVIVEKVPNELKEEVPRYIVPQEEQGAGRPTSGDNSLPEWVDSDATKSAVTKHLP